jgi:hypothetical protein
MKEGWRDTGTDWRFEAYSAAVAIGILGLCTFVKAKNPLAIAGGLGMMVYSGVILKQPISNFLKES